MTLPEPVNPALWGVNLNNTLGAGLIGLIFSAMLFGIVGAQALSYYQNSARDTPYKRWTVLIWFLLNALHLVAVSHVAYNYLVTNFTNLSVISELPWSFCLHVIITAVNGLIVRVYYTRMVWIGEFSPGTDDELFLSFQVLTLRSKQEELGIDTRLISMFGFGIKTSSFESSKQFSTIFWVICVSLASVVAAEVCVAALLCYFLAGKKTGGDRTNIKIDILRTYIINAGLLTSICTICAFVTFTVMPDNCIFIGITFVLPGLYSNSLLATLNARERLHDGLRRNDGLGVGAYQLQHIVTIGAGSGSQARWESTEKTDTTHSSSSNANTSFEEKDVHRIAVNVEVESEFHSGEIRNGFKRHSVDIINIV
ncbi:hypothetical protein M0805_009546 [Coniferiporia weirii]|nr:hypothetical protein M0805_009546 [Coniferiporia weirii]